MPILLTVYDNISMKNVMKCVNSVKLLNVKLLNVRSVKCSQSVIFHFHVSKND